MAFGVTDVAPHPGTSKPQINDGQLLGLLWQAATATAAVRHTGPTNDRLRMLILS
jgi:hypothetical protein